MAKRQLPLFPAQPKSQEDISKQTPLGATFELFREYLAKEGKSEHTIKAFMGDLYLFSDHTGVETPVGQYLTSHLNEFLHWLEFGRGVSCSRKSYARRVTTLKVYFKWLYNLNAVQYDPAKPVLQRSGPAPLSNVLNQEQIEEAILFSHLMKRSDHRDYRPEVLFRLLLDTGIKKSEAARLEVSDIDRSNPEMPTVLIKHTVRNVYKERRIELASSWMQALDFYQQQYPVKDKLFTCTPRNLEYILTDIGEGADIPFKLSFEVMRWTSAVRDYRNAIEEEAIREKLGLSKTSWYETSTKIKRLVELQLKDET